MGIIARQSLRNTIITYAGVALGFLLTIWLYPQILSPRQYGLTRALLALAMVSTQFADLGMRSTIIRYFPTFRNQDKNHHGFLFLSLFIPFIGMLLLSVILVGFRPAITNYFIDQSELLVNFYWFILPLTFSILFFKVLSSYLQALYDTVMSSFLMDIGVRFLAVILLVIYVLGWITFTQFIIIFVLNYTLILAVLIAYLFVISPVSLKPDFEFLSQSLVKKMASYSIYVFWGGIAWIIVANIDLIMITSMVGLAEAGIYAIAFYIGSAIRIISHSVYKISNPVISNAFKNDDFELIEDIFQRSALNQLIIGALILIGIIANIDNLIALLPPEYSEITTVVIIIGSGFLLKLMSGINGSILLNSKYYRFNLWFSLIFVSSAIVLNYLLIPIYGIIGAAIGSASALVILNMLNVSLIWTRINIQPFQFRMLPVFIIGGLTLFITFQIPLIINPYVDIIVRSLIVVILFVTPIWFLNISKNINELIDKSLKLITSWIL